MSDNLTRSRQATMAAAIAAARKSRAEAPREVNWLLVEEARQINRELAEQEETIALWEASLDAEIQSAENAGSTTDVELLRRQQQDTRSKIEAQRQAVAREYNERRDTFAEMLYTVRRSAAAPLEPETVSAIHGLNADGYLAEATGMGSQDFAAYYGRPPAQPVLAARAAAQATVGGIDFARSAAPQTIPAPRSPQTAATKSRLTRAEALRRMHATPAVEAERSPEMER